MRTAIEQLMYAARTLTRNKRFAALAIASLGVAIALNTTMYSVLDAIVFPRIAMHAPDRLYHLSFFGDYRRVVTDQERTEAIRSLGFYSAMTRAIPSFAGNIAERGNVIRQARVLNVAANYFEVMGNQPSAGRLIGAGDVDSDGGAVVMSERLWRRLFSGMPFTDTASFILDGEPRVVVGLLPHEADFPGANTDIWQIPSTGRTYNPGFFGIVRLREGADARTARGELKLLAERISMRGSGRPDDAHFRLRSAMREPLRVKAFHKALIGAVVFVLLVACVNLANLQLARGVSRARELATRAAIGASRATLMRQLLLESSWLALGGLLLGSLLTYLGMELVLASVPPALDEYLLRPQVSWRVFAFGGAATLTCLIIVGLAPAVRLSRVDINEVLKTGAGTGTTRRKRLQYGTLVVVQAALALTLLVGATLLLRVAAVVASMELRPGADRIVQTYVAIEPVGGDIDGRNVLNEATRLVNRTRAIPAVANAASIIWGRTAGRAVTLDDPGGAPRVIGTGRWSYAQVSPSYIRTLGVQVVKGRDFSEGEFAEPLVIVDQLTARFLWPGADPIGQLIKMGDAESDRPWLRVVGVTEHFNFWAPFTGANQEERLAPRMGAVYVLHTSDTTTVGDGTMIQMTVRGTTNVHRLPSVLRRELNDPARGVAIRSAEPIARVVGLEMMKARQNFVATLFVTFALLALGVAALGVYAIVSHSVSQRRREFGVRIAVGASSTDIRQNVLREGNLLALIGIALGLVLASQTVQMLQAFLRGEEDRYDSWLYAIAAAVLFGVMLLASYLPARRAMRINPTEALRND